MSFDMSGALKQVREMGNDFIERLPYILVALLVFALFYAVGTGVRTAIRRAVENRRRARSLGLVLGRLTHGLIVFLGLLVALVIALPGFKPAQLVQFLGIGSVAVGFAFRDILQNFLAGILLLLGEPFRIGDQIIVGNFEGTVEDIQTRATIIKTYDGRRVVIPNADLFTDAVMVNTAFAQRRLEYDVGIGYGDDIEKARALILEAIHSVSGVLAEPPPDVLVMELAPSTINLRARWWVQPPRQFDVLIARDEVLTAIKKTLTENGIDLPFPTQQILFHDQTEETDGNRSRQREGWPVGNKPVPRPARIADALGLLAQMMAQSRSSDESQNGDRTVSHPDGLRGTPHLPDHLPDKAGSE